MTINYPQYPVTPLVSDLIPQDKPKGENISATFHNLSNLLGTKPVHFSRLKDDLPKLDMERRTSLHQ